MSNETMVVTMKVEDLRSLISECAEASIRPIREELDMLRSLVGGKAIEEVLYGQRDIANHLHVSTRTLHKYISDGVLDGVVHKFGGTFRARVEDLDKMKGQL